MPVGWNHSRLGILKKALLRRRDPKHWRASRAVQRSMHLPRARRALDGAEIWAVMMVKNEQDIIRSTIDHIFSQGFDRLLIVDNLSTDHTPNILLELAEEHPIILGHDLEPAYYQSVKMTMLARWASRHGAGWIVPMDADEYWFAEGQTVADFLRATPHAMIEAPIHNLFPTPQNHEPSGLRSGPLRFDFAPHKMPKVAVKASQMVWLGMGNHWGLSPGSTGDGLHVAHLPWRSKRQLVNKLRQGAAALSRTTLDSNLGNHWRRGGQRTDEDLESVWEELLHGGADEALGWAPLGPFTITDARSWSNSWPELTPDEFPTESQ